MAELVSRQAGSGAHVLIGGMARKSCRPVLLMNKRAENLSKILATRIQQCSAGNV